MNSKSIIPVILCGGLGTRLWPPQDDKLPKQFCALVTDKTLLQDTIERAAFCCGKNLQDIIFVTSEIYEDVTRAQIEEMDLPFKTHILSEPQPKNTAIAIAYALNHVQENHARGNFEKNPYLWILPSDHEVQNFGVLKDNLQSALTSDVENILTFGIKPNTPNTQYGYIQVKAEYNENIMSVENFTEKPNEEIAKEYLKAGNYYWNSGMFLARLDVLTKAYVDNAPKIFNAIKNTTNIQETYKNLEPISFDFAVMEKAPNIEMIKSNIGWKDVGSWDNLSAQKREEFN